MKNAFEYEAELAALREELLRLEEEYDTLEHANITLKLSVADAERRNVGLIENLGEAYERGYSDGQNNPNGYSDKADRDACVASLKSAESGASE